MDNSRTGKDSTFDLCLQKIFGTMLTPLDFLPQAELAEKLIDLELHGPPAGLKTSITSELSRLRETLSSTKVDTLKVVVLGGGTGLSNIVGGDSKNPSWKSSPFGGLKNIFPNTRSIVCITDDGGSTGELLKDLPLIALGDIRRVLLSSIQRQILYFQYGLDDAQALQTASVLYELLNHRFTERPVSPGKLIEESGADLRLLPEAMQVVLQRLISFLYEDRRLKPLLVRSHCLGNLMIAAAIYLQIDNLASSSPFPAVDDNDCPVPQIFHLATILGLKFFSQLIGADPLAIMPCTTTQALLQMLYSNGVLVTGEYKSADTKRNYPVDRVFVEFAAEPQVPLEAAQTIREADIILLAPGSLYTSTIPILQVPGLSEEIRSNNRALKLLVANFWVQTGETDAAHDDPNRRFHVSDLIAAYHRNIPGGVHGLFQHVLALGLRDIPGSILQNYALEEKVPIYLDRERVQDMGFTCIEAGIFSQAALIERRIIQHDPDILARAVRTLWVMRHYLTSREDEDAAQNLPQAPPKDQKLIKPADMHIHHQRHTAMNKRLRNIEVLPAECRADVLDMLSEVLWKHADIPVRHLDNFPGLIMIDPVNWKRSQKWDNVFSFYDPPSGTIKIRCDMLTDNTKFETAFLIALGQSLLGNYAATKEMLPVVQECGPLGKVYKLTLTPPAERTCYLVDEELDQYLCLARMMPAAGDDFLYTRLVNASEGFTPPGLLFGLLYAWYLDNRFSSHIEYKMAIIKNEVSNLIPEQVKMRVRRQALIDFFRTIVFRHDSIFYKTSPTPGTQL
jgi:uncharacterized cofD-like protein